jgi:hypothetical protein
MMSGMEERSRGSGRTPGGSDIVRHDPAGAAEGGADAAPAWRLATRHEQLLAHFTRQLGPTPGPVPGFGAGEVSLYVHGPTGRRPFLTVTTIGMSDQPAPVPDDLADRAYQELLMYLPADWDVAGAADDPAAGWPFRLLSQLAVLPRNHATFFAPGHTLAMGERPAPFDASTVLSAVAFMRPGREDSLFDDALIDRVRCQFLWVVPISRGELQYKLDHGFNKLLNALSEAKVPYAVDPRRACAITGEQVTTPPPAGGKKRRWWGR